MIASIALTRRAIYRKQFGGVPKFVSQHPPLPSGTPAPGVKSPAGDAKSDGAMDAFQALNLATLNCISFGIMLTGGLSYAFDISSLQDLKQKARRTIYNYPPGGEKSDEDVERELEEWAASLLVRVGKKTGEGEGSGEEKQGPDSKSK